MYQSNVLVITVKQEVLQFKSCLTNGANDHFLLKLQERIHSA